MKKLLASVALCVAATSANAATFDFNWTNSNGSGTYTATGTVEIDAGAGDTFTLADILSTSIAVSGPTLPSYVFTSWNSIGGTIAADGLSASLSAAGNPFYRAGDGEQFFGCLGVECADSTIRVRGSFATGSTDFFYGSPSAALASFELTAPSEIPLPASGILLLAALGGLAFARRKS